MSKVEIHYDDTKEFIVDFAVDNIDYRCEYDYTILDNTYPTSFNSVTNRITYAQDESELIKMAKETLTRTDGQPIDDPQKIIDLVEKKMNQ